jgi:tRNA (adenine57-N1/adenine58-N1)-methyltransferase
MIERASRNVQRAGLSDSVTFHQQSIEAGFEQTDIDALFLDVREPWLYLRQATAALTEGGFFGALVPTVNQVVDLVKAAVRQPIADLEVLELLERRYKPVPERVRPLDRLTAHTGFLIFGRRLAEARRAPEREPGIAALGRPKDAEHPESDHGVDDWSEDPAVEDWSEGREADDWSEGPGASPSESDADAEAP